MEEKNVNVEKTIPQVEVKTINVNSNIKDGQYKCPNCGASEIMPNPQTGKLRCNYCMSEFDGKELIGVEKNISNLQGKIVGKGTQNIKEGANNMVTLKCGGCGAEIVIDTSDAPHARCHWCRSVLSVNNQLENGAIPDMILPFQTKKEDAEAKIQDFVKKRRFFANPTFKKEFTTENIMGVYFPYLIVDANAHAKFAGEGEHLVKVYRGDGDSPDTYDADLYKVEREFDIIIDDLSIESNLERLDKNSLSQTNNIINSVMPFDTENCIQYQSNYLVGYTSERRDVNIDDLEEKVNKQLKDVARFAAKEESKFYDRGIKWTTEDFHIVGTQWLAAYLPVWLYSYMEVKGNSKVLHYVAVNARTKETMGSVPINQPLLILISTIIEIICGSLGIFIFLSVMSDTSSSDDGEGVGYLALLLLSAGFVFYLTIYSRYRNHEARHTYEKETKKTLSNLVKKDEFIKHEKRVRNPAMIGANDDKIDGEESVLKKKSRMI